MISKLAALQSNFSSHNTRELIFSIVLGRILSDNEVLPNAPVESLKEYFNLTIKPNIINKLGILNEAILIDITVTVEYVYKFYSLRYYQLYSETKAYYIDPTKPVISFFSINKSLSETDIETIELYKDQLNSYFKWLVEITNELKLVNEIELTPITSE